MGLRQTARSELFVAICLRDAFDFSGGFSPSLGTSDPFPDPPAHLLQHIPRFYFIMLELICLRVKFYFFVTPSDHHARQLMPFQLFCQIHPVFTGFPNIDESLICIIVGTAHSLRLLFRQIFPLARSPVAALSALFTATCNFAI